MTKRPDDDFNSDPFQKQRKSPRDASLRGQPGIIDKGKQNRNLLLVIGAVILVVGFFGSQNRKDDSASEISPTTQAAASSVGAAASSDGSHRLVSDTLGCQSRDRLSKLVGYLVDGDKATYMSDGQAAIDAGDCAQLKGDTQVYLSSVPFGSGLIQVRQKGATALWWVATESVK